MGFCLTKNYFLVLNKNVYIVQLNLFFIEISYEYKLSDNILQTCVLLRNKSSIVYTQFIVLDLILFNEPIDSINLTIYG